MGVTNFICFFMPKSPACLIEMRLSAPKLLNTSTSAFMARMRGRKAEKSVAPSGCLTSPTTSAPTSLATAVKPRVISWP
ncbi:Uncharacterised protein [Mycobacteroides abscessus subsp. abscessus]|nr:Uncharacterised protein [Mycobacteroides abscessus subsp. abscessus]